MKLQLVCILAVTLLAVVAARSLKEVDNDAAESAPHAGFLVGGKLRHDPAEKSKVLHEVKQALAREMKKAKHDENLVKKEIHQDVPAEKKTEEVEEKVDDAPRRDPKESKVLHEVKQALARAMKAKHDENLDKKETHHDVPAAKNTEEDEEEEVDDVPAAKKTEEDEEEEEVDDVPAAKKTEKDDEDEEVDDVPAAKKTEEDEEEVDDEPKQFDSHPYEERLERFLALKRRKQHALEDSRESQ